jgi:hypothetical protein
MKNVGFRKVSSHLFVLILIFIASTQHVSAFSGDGAGTSLDPFQISTCVQLQEMNGELDSHYVLVNDIDCADSATWNENVDEWVDGVVDGTLIADEYVGVINNGYYGFEPIGWDSAANNSGPGFTGTLDGQQHTISNLWIFRKGNDFTGLIGYATNAVIKDLTLDNPRVVGAAHTGGFLGRGAGVVLTNLENYEGMVRAYLEYYGGGIAGYLEDLSAGTGLSTADGYVHGSGNVIGGLVGLLDGGSVEESDASADVDGGEYIGGAFGTIRNNALVSDVSVSGSVTSNDADDLYFADFSKTGRYTGGFAGYISESTIDDVTASGLVAADDNYAGGFAGLITESEISDSSSTGSVSGNEFVGGFAGIVQTSSNIFDSTASGNVASVEGYAGGFAGMTSCGSAFLRASALGNVASNGYYIGGFVGSDSCMGTGSSFTQAAAHGDVTGTGTFVGGFIGVGAVSTFSNAYAGGDVTGNDIVGGFAGSVNTSDVYKTYARGVVVGGDVPEYIGGFAAEVQGETSIAFSFSDTDTSGQPDLCGSGECVGVTGTTTVEAKTQSTYVGAEWDFESVWDINSDNDGYPHFFWESFGPQVGSGTVEDPYQMTQCFDATESGYYELQNNITGVNGTCITIEADDVFIDGGAHTIIGSFDEGSSGIFSEDYDSISISNIGIESFHDGIRLLSVQGTSTITDVAIEGVADDGIDIRGASGVTISDSTVTDVGDQGIRFGEDYDQNDDPVFNTDIVIQDVVVSDSDDVGITLENVTGLLVSDNEVFDTDDDGIAAYVIENAEILNNSVHDIYSDGIYVEEGVNVLISENTVTNVTNADGIDIDNDEDDNYDITITDNVVSNINDYGIEIYALHGGTITGNQLNASNGGIDIGSSDDIEFSNNTITPTTSTYFAVPAVTTESVALDPLDADLLINESYTSFTYTLPFTFNFQGRDITDIEVNTNGSLELLESGDSCEICANQGDYENFLPSAVDTLFASFDGLFNSFSPDDYVAAFSPNDDEYVVVEWRGTTQFDGDSDAYPVHFQVVLYPDGEVQWNFMEMAFQSYYYDMFTGAYDSETEDIYRAGLAISEPSSYRADFSGDTEYELIESFDPNEGIDLYGVSDSSFIGNSIHADQWITAENSENVVFNDADSGNTYRLLSGEGAWTLFDIVDTDGNGYADSGTDRPFSEATVGAGYWSGEGEDAHPAALAASAPVEERKRGGTYKRTQVRVDTRDEDRDESQGGAGSNAESAPSTATVSTARQLQRFLNTNGFPVAQAGPGSLNNETDTFGELTKQALIKFQKANGISPALGIFGPITKAFINGAGTTRTTGGTPATQAPATLRDLTLGSIGADVTKLQAFLAAEGLAIPAGATGYFGQQTKDALIAYQKKHAIVPASGYFGSLTRAHMVGKGLVLR